MTEGTLFVKIKKNKKGNIKKDIQLIFTNSRAEYSTKNLNQIPPEQVSLALTEKLAENIRQEITVQFEEEGDQLLKIREKGTDWDRPEAKPVKPTEKKNKEIQAFTRKSTSKTNKNIVGEFHNPYNFIPALSRKHLDNYPEKDIAKELGDDLPKGHGCYHQNYWSGRISVTLKTVTPLLIPDASNATEDKNNHKTYSIRIDSEGKPYLPSTSIKGMVRSAYEAVTNSRLSIFKKHQDRLAYRMSTKIGLQMIPARIENNRIYLYTGTSEISNDGKPIQGYPMYAAWLKCYNPNNSERARRAIRYPNNSLPEHGEKITAWIEKYQKVRNNGQVVFSYWKVRKIVRFGEKIGQKPEPSNGFRNHQSLGEIQKVNGFVCLTNKNIDNKHDERLFFSINSPIEIELNCSLKKKWTELISNYQKIHETERNQGKLSPPALNNSVWSRHITGGELEKSLSDGTLCYAQVQKNGNDYNVINLYPVMISRGLYQVSPDSLLKDSKLHPASYIDELSPADRVFGWVKQNKGQSKTQKGTTSYKGNLRIFNVTCRTDDGIESFGDTGFPLTILGEPKEQQARFYQAQDKSGTPLDNSREEQAYSDVDQGLRGRKVYPHHNGLPDKYWSEPQKYRSEDINGYYQEYRQPSGEKEKTDQNRSIKAWVKPNVEFSFTIDIINLSPVELGALLWLLSLEDNYYHRLGGGKPLGFGSVQLNINWDNTDLRTGEDWQKYYQSLFPINKPDAKTAETCIELFKTALEQAYGNGTTFQDISFITAFRTSAKGFDDKLPIHYPRTTKERNPKGEGFDWFVDNERVGQGLKLPLPSLAEDTGLPFNPCQNQSNNSTNNRR